MVEGENRERIEFRRKKGIRLLEARLSNPDWKPPPDLVDTVSDWLNVRQGKDKKIHQASVPGHDTTTFADLPSYEIEDFIKLLNQNIIIADTAGKGGTGKTTIATLQAAFLSNYHYEEISVEYKYLDDLTSKFARGFKSDAKELRREYMKLASSTRELALKFAKNYTKDLDQVKSQLIKDAENLFQRYEQLLGKLESESITEALPDAQELVELADSLAEKAKDFTPKDGPKVLYVDMDPGRQGHRYFLKRLEYEGELEGIDEVIAGKPLEQVMLPVNGVDNLFILPGKRKKMRTGSGKRTQEHLTAADMDTLREKLKGFNGIVVTDMGAGAADNEILVDGIAGWYRLSSPCISVFVLQQNDANSHEKSYELAAATIDKIINDRYSGEPESQTLFKEALDDAIRTTGNPDYTDRKKRNPQTMKKVFEYITGRTEFIRTLRNTAINRISNIFERYIKGRATEQEVSTIINHYFKPERTQQIKELLETYKPAKAKFRKFIRSHASSPKEFFATVEDYLVGKIEGKHMLQAIKQNFEGRELRDQVGSDVVQYTKYTRAFNRAIWHHVDRPEKKFMEQVEAYINNQIEKPALTRAIVQHYSDPAEQRIVSHAAEKYKTTKAKNEPLVNEIENFIKTELEHAT